MKNCHECHKPCEDLFCSEACRQKALSWVEAARRLIRGIATTTQQVGVKDE